MKKSKKYNLIYPLLAAVMLLAGACGDFLNVNTDPTRLKTSSVPLVMTGAQTNLAFTEGSDTFLYSTLFIQQMTGNGVTGSQTRQYDSWIVANSDVNNAWGNYYAGPLADLNYIRQNTYKDGNPQYGGIAKILQAYTYSTLVQAWGDVPYKEAMKGGANLQPKYDGSKEIYDSLFVLIDAGIADLAKTNIRTVGTEDLFYAGNMTKWTRMANTLKLRLALHYANVDNGVKLNALIAAGGPFMTGNADNFEMAFENVTNRQNPIHQFEVSRADYLWPAKYIVDLMNGKSDPRRTTYFQPYPYPGTNASYVPQMTDSYVGLAPAGLNGTQTVAASRIGTYLRGTVTADSWPSNASRSPAPDPTPVPPANVLPAPPGTRAYAVTTAALTYTGAAPMRLLTFAEYNFIRAEASLVYGAPGTAATFFAAGINASIAAAGLQGAAATAGTTYAAAQTLTLQTLIEEKFVANYGVPMESWNDWRRTGIPALTLTDNPGAAAAGNTVRPRILVYPLSETQVNAANLPARASGTVKGVFWDK